MTTIVAVGAASFLILLAIMLKVRAAKPKRAEKWEKAEIMKRLLALSEKEDIANGISRQQPLAKKPAPRRRAAAAAGASTSRAARA